jgi:hypothetical protein
LSRLPVTHQPETSYMGINSRVIARDISDENNIDRLVKPPVPFFKRIGDRLLSGLSLNQ